MIEIKVQPLTAQAFAPFGDVIELRSEPDKVINQGNCGRHHDLAKMSFGQDGRAGISLFDAKPRSLPYTLDMVERHPDGSQAFVPMTEHGFLVIVAEDGNGTPKQPFAFVTQSGQGVNYHAGTWHGVLTPLAAPGLFAVVDRIGNSPNLEEYYYPTPFVIVGDPDERPVRS